MAKYIDTHKQIRNMPVSKRPTMIPLFPTGARYFQSWRSVRWFILMLIPIWSSAIAAAVRKQSIMMMILICLIGSGFTAILFVSYCSEMISSNLGTYFKKTEPIRYWLQIIVLVIIYAAFAIAGYQA